MKLRFTGAGFPYELYQAPGMVLRVGESVEVSDDRGARLLADFGPAFVRVDVAASPVDRMIHEVSPRDLVDVRRTVSELAEWLDTGEADGVLADLLAGETRVTAISAIRARMDAIASEE